MQTFVDASGSIRYGIFEGPVGRINYADYPLKTPMGLPLPTCLKRLKANQFVFVGAVGPECIVGMAVVDLKYLTNGFFYVFDRQTREVFETKRLSPPGKGISIEPDPDRLQARFQARDLAIVMDGPHIQASGRGFSFSAHLELDRANPLRICTRAGYRDWVYVQKTNPVHLSGRVSYAGRTLELATPPYLASIDWTCGYMRRRTCWNWASISTFLPDKRSLGLNLSCGVNETSFTENAFWVDSVLTKVDTVHFEYDADDLYRPWHITSYDGRVDLTFHPEAHRDESTDALLLTSRFTQLMGTFEGTLKTQTGEEIGLSGCPGYAEDHYAKW